MAIRPHVCDSWNITKQKEIEKTMQCSSIKSPTIWYGGGFSWKEDIIIHSLLKKCKITHFFNEISSKSFKF
jgi:hypothetical protein